MRVLIGVPALLLALAAAGNAGAAESAGAKCSAATLRGTYLYAYAGATLAGKGAGPFASAGRETYDGRGHVAGVSTTSTDGKIAERVRLTGTYTVSADCVGAVTYSDGSTYDQFIAPDGGTLVYVQTNAGTVAAGSEQRAARRVAD